MTAALVLAVAACGGDEPAETTGAETPTTAAPATTSAPETTAAPETTSAPETTAAGDDSDADATISIAGLSFGGDVTIDAGGTVEVINNDSLPHTWTADDGTFDVSLSPGDSATRTIDEPGEYSFFCSIHPEMTGTLTVEG